ncbi:MAG: O-antigen ligase family protein [Cyanobacteria bacterium K_Offshore_0m_m2_072]|nr:O-antigen ligase family protein [Cyanobacteria bacterium K_Offshore_0m_m2_072]
MNPTALNHAVQRGLSWLGEQTPSHCSRRGWCAFQAGLFWMPSSALIGGLLLFLSLTLWAPLKQSRPLQRPLARVLLALSTLMVVTTIAAAPALTLEQQLRLMNWLPFFWFFLAMRPYLSTPAARNRLAMALVAGTVPIAVLGLAQATFGFSGPWQALGGLLAWDLPELYKSRGAGAFPNPNFTAAWYAMVLPLAAAQVLRWRTASTTLRGWPLAPLSWGVLALLAIALYVCGSRNALLVTPITLLALSPSIFALPLLVICGSLGALLALALWGSGLGIAWSPAITLAQWATGNFNWKVAAMVTHRSGSADDPLRQELYPKAWRFISAHPWLGGGERLLPGSPEALQQPSGLTHLHSLPLQFAINHGLPALLLLTALVVWLGLRAWRALGRQHLPQNSGFQLVDRSLVIAATTAIWLHVLDIPSFDSRINVLGWVLLGVLGVLGSTPPPTVGHSGQPGESARS